MTKSEIASAAAGQSSASAAPRLLYVVTEDWYFLAHRLPMARAARDAGFEVHVATNVKDGEAAIAAEGFILHAVPFARGRISPLASFRTVTALRRVYGAVAPAIIHHTSLQPIVLGSIAAVGSTASRVNAFTGLGHVFIAPTIKAAAVRWTIAAILSRLLNRERTVSLVENPDDASALVDLGIPKDRIVVGNGSGVDTRRLAPLPEPRGSATVAFVGRLLADKGIWTLLNAHRLLRSRGLDVQLLIAGTPDPANPASMTPSEVASWNGEPRVSWLGHVSDIPALWARAHLAVLPSRREGLPLSLLEAAACGRAMVATDVPGCREIVIRDETGILTPVDDAPALADAIAELLRNPQQRAAYGAAARRLVEQKFSAEIVQRQTLALYRGMLATHAKSSDND